MGLGALLSFAACDRGSPTFDAVEMGPKVKVQLTIPERDAIDVPLDQSIRIQFDRFLSPLSVTRQAVCIASVGPTTSESGRPSCERFPRAQYDPVERVAVFEPSQPLQPGLRYTVVVRAPEEGAEDSDGIRAIDGAPLEASHVFAFTTERRGPCTEDEDCREGASCLCEDRECARKSCQLPSKEPKREIDYCQDAPTLCTLPQDGCGPPGLVPMTTRGPRRALEGCSGSSACHGSGSRLSLANDGIRHYIGKVATGTASWPDPTDVNRQGSPFGVNMPYVDPGFPANSYLLWKLVLGMEGQVVERPFHPHDGYRCEDLPEAGAQGDCPLDAGTLPEVPPVVRAGAEQQGPVEPWIPVELSQPIAEGEYERLGRSLRGHAMPAGREARIELPTIRAISAWIAAGAPVPECE